MQEAMGTVAVFYTCLAVVALCAAMLHFGLDQLHRTREHFWLGVAALGIVQLAVGNAMTYDAQTAAEASGAQIVSLLCAVPLVIGFLRFTALVSNTNILPMELGVGGFAVVSAIATVVWPDLYLSEELVQVEIAWLGLQFVEFRLTKWAGVSLLPFTINFTVVTYLFWTRRSRFEFPGWIVGSMAIWTLASFSDAAVAAGLYRAPYLVVVGYLCFLTSFTVVLIRRFVSSLNRLEAGNMELQQIVDERTVAIRNKDLQVAHGARMATVGTLSAGLAREIRRPLSDVINRIEDVADDFGRPGAERIEERVTEARKGIQRIQSIVSNLLHVARRDVGSFGPVDLNQVVEGVLPIVRHEAEDRARLETQLGDIPRVRGDERLLGQVLLNLVLNALQSLPLGERDQNLVIVSTEPVEGGVALCVRDTGPGIPSEVQELVFEPFFSTQPSGEGTGLGLAVTQELVERHRGQIELASSPEGTIVRVRLPELSEEATASRAGSGRDESDTGGTHGSDPGTLH